MKLITELTESVEYLIEGEGNNKKYYITGPFLTANQANKNRRVYPQSVMESAVTTYKKDYIDSKGSMGELNHPPTPTINLDRVSHVTESLSFDGDHVIGKARLLNTPMGKIARQLMDEGVRLGVSSRGLGSIRTMSNGLNEVQSDFTLRAIDIVSDPSGPGCFVNGLMENIEYLIEDGKLIEVMVDKAKGKINEEKALSAFQDLMLSLNEGFATDHSIYWISHRKQAKGHGSWFVTINHRFLNFDKHKEGVHYIQHNGSLSEALQKAKDTAKKQGLKSATLYPQP